jgi:hypothetical protein
MAAGLGFKDFVTGEVLTAADVDGYLMQGIWVFASAAARNAAVTSPQEGNACYLKDTDQLLTYSGSAWVAVGGGGGKVLQVVSTVLDDTFSASSASFTDVTGLSRAITPSSATSKILVMVQLSASQAVGVNRCMFRMMRDSTAINVGVINGSRIRATSGVGVGNDTLVDTGTMIFLDSPSTTSSTTYKVQGIVGAGSGSFYVNRSYTWNDDGNATYTSTITCMEIGA